MQRRYWLPPPVGRTKVTANRVGPTANVHVHDENPGKRQEPMGKVLPGRDGLYRSLME